MTGDGEIVSFLSLSDSTEPQSEYSEKDSTNSDKNTLLDEYHESRDALQDSHHSQIMKTIRQKAKSFEKEIMDSPDKDLNIFIPVEILLPDLTADNVEAVNCENGADSSLPIGKKRFLLDSGPLLSASSYWEGIVPKFLLDNHNLYKEDENCSRFIKGSGHKINVSTSKSNFDRLLLQIYKKSVRADTNHKILQELEELNNNKFTSKDDLKILREFRDRMN